MAKGFAAGGAGFRPDNVGAHPTATFFALRIDTLNSGARHQGHKTLPQWLRAQRAEMSPLSSQEMSERTGTMARIVALA